MRDTTAHGKLLERLVPKGLLKKDPDDNVENRDGCLYASRSAEMFFRDGKRRIDFVLAYHPKPNDEINRIKRTMFLKALADQMVEIEVEDCFGNLLAATGPVEAGFTTDARTKLQQVISQKAAVGFITDEERTYDPEDDEADKDLVVVKLHAPWPTLARIAEILQFRKPVKTAESDSLKFGPTVNLFPCLQLDVKDVLPVPRCYTWPFTRARQYLFDMPDCVDDFFTQAERSLVVNYVLQRTGIGIRGGSDNHGNADDSQSPLNNATRDIEFEYITGARQEDIRLAVEGVSDLGIDKLVSDGVFQASYPLHEPSTRQQGTSEVNIRILLTNEWASLKKIMKAQPLDYVRLYFGESIAMYFAWLGFYTRWLIPVAIFGLLVFLFAAIDINDDGIINDVCNNGHKFIMCPQCDIVGCRFWLLNTSCFTTKLTHLVDNFGTVLYAVFVALWATIFLELWKRKQFTLAYRWNVHSLEPVEQPPRPEFLALLSKKNYQGRVNPVTGHTEPHIPFWSRRFPVFLLSYTSVLLGVVLALAFLVGVIFYRLVVNLLLRQTGNPIISTTAGMITTATSSCINLVCIFILKLIYDRVAVLMTNLENHRTQTDYDSSLTLKLYMLQFINYYSSVFYIAFIQGTTAAVPGGEHPIIQSTGCDGGNCLFELFIQLAIVMVGKQLLNFVQENTLPPLKRFAKKFFNRRKQKKLAQKKRLQRFGDASQNYGSVGTTGAAWEGEGDPPDNVPTDHHPTSLTLCRKNFGLLDPGSRPLFEEYLEMMIQFGFITIFVPAFPIAPLFALVNNVMELRTDAKKFLHQFRRPISVRNKSIGIWFSILSVLSRIAVRSNACLIAFTSDFIVRLVYTHSYNVGNVGLGGYVNFSLSYMSVDRFNISAQDEILLNNATLCRYPDFRQSPDDVAPYEFTEVYWHILAAKFIFVFLFENVALFLTALIANVVPDQPGRLNITSRYEARVTNQLILDCELRRDKGEDMDELHGIKNRQPSAPLPKIGFFDYVAMAQDSFDQPPAIGFIFGQANPDGTPPNTVSS